jgi:hypothetical protein
LGKVKDKPIDGIVIRQLDRVGAGWRWVCRVCS